MTSSDNRSQPRRAVAASGEAIGFVYVVLPEVTAYGAALTTIGLTRRVPSLLWLSARGKRLDLLDDALRGRALRVNWLRYTGSGRRYIDGDVQLLPHDNPGARLRPHPDAPTQRHQGRPPSPVRGC